jgi:serine/threonine-protein kinase
MISYENHPRRISKYIIEDYLGGGMSHVYRATDPVIGRTVALKVLTEAGSEDPDAKERFLLEARTVGNVSHDNIVKIFDFGDDDGRAFMVMEFLLGEDLRCAIKAGRTGDSANKLKIAWQLACGFEHIHTQRIIHRDIKPSNAWITDTAVAKIVDFGIAKTEGLKVTRTGMVVGTPYYMAPEQIVGQDITGQVDIYAFGALLFELFCGEGPIKAESVTGIFYAILNEPLDESPLRRAGVPGAVRELIVTCMSKKPVDRPQGFAPVRASLERLLGNANAGSEPMRGSRRSEAAKAQMVGSLATGTVDVGNIRFPVMITGPGGMLPLASSPAPAQQPQAKGSEAQASPVQPRQPHLPLAWKSYRTVVVPVVAVVVLIIGLDVSLRPPSLAELLRDAQQQSRSAPLKARVMYQDALRLDPGNQAALYGLRELEQRIAIDEGR